MPRLRLPRLPRVRFPKLGRDAATTVIEVAGLACLDAATWWWCPIAGLAVLGGMLVFVGWVMGE